MDVLLTVVQTINNYLSNYILIILLIGTGLVFSIRTRFVQVRCFGEGLKMMKPGAHYILYIPGDLAYGVEGQPYAGIKANETLVFDVEVVGLAD